MLHLRSVLLQVATQLQAAAAYVTDHAGGQGAVRELCEFLLVAQGFDPLALYQEDRV